MFQLIVNYVLANNNDFKGAADKYSVPYANIYNWVKKYNEIGEDGIKDSRGRPSSKEPKHGLTEIERKDIEIERLKGELERSTKVIEVLKKNIEIQERMERDSRLLGKKTNIKRQRNLIINQALLLIFYAKYQKYQDLVITNGKIEKFLKKKFKIMNQQT